MPSRVSLPLTLALAASVQCSSQQPTHPQAVDELTERGTDDAVPEVLPTEPVSGQVPWFDPELTKTWDAPEVREHASDPTVAVRVWFDRQLLGDGNSYLRRIPDLSKRRRRELRVVVRRTLEQLSERSFAEAEEALAELVAAGQLADIQRRWVVNGFGARATREGLAALGDVPGVAKVFLVRPLAPEVQGTHEAEFFPPSEHEAGDRSRFKHPWYTRYLQADRAWRAFGATGKGTLNVIHDFGFRFGPHLTRNLYRREGEIPGNGKDDDGNGLVDDYHGFNFAAGTAAVSNASGNHGYRCASYVCAVGSEESDVEFGIAPDALWAPLVVGHEIEAAVEWAIEQGADTYSMSFSLPDLGEYRSHWRKMMEHAALAGVYFVSGAGNFGFEGSPSYAPVPVQMRTPEDIPNAVFAAAGLTRKLEPPPFSSRGPVMWKTEHYRDGEMGKPEVVAFNAGLPVPRIDGTVGEQLANGNSFAGPMLAASIALMLSADPDLLPWDLSEIITSTAMDVGAPGVDHRTGHGLVNVYRAVREVLRRKAVREGGDPTPYSGREAGDEVAVTASPVAVRVIGVVPEKAKPRGPRVGDTILRYAGVDIATRLDLRGAIRSAARGTDKRVELVVERAGKRRTLRVGTGRLGVVLREVWDEPDFQ